MRKVNILIMMVLALFLLGAMVGCGEATPAPTATPAVAPTATPTATPTAKPTPTPVEPIKIGLVEDSSGPIGAYGAAHLAGDKLAVKIINDAGGIKSLGGAMIEIAIGNGDSTVATSISEVERLITSQKVVAIAGPTSNAEVLGCLPLFERYKIPCVACLQDAAQYEKGYRYIIGLHPSTQSQGRDQAEFIDWLAKKHGAPTDSIAICNATPTYEMKVEGMIPRLAELGYTNIVLRESFPLSVTDQGPLVMKLKATDPSLVVYLGALQDAVAFHKACYTYDYYPWLVCEQEAYGNQLIPGALSEDIAKATLLRPNVFGTGIGIATERFKDTGSIKEFRDAFYKEYPGSTLHYASVATAGQMVFTLARAIENAASRNPEDIANELHKTDIQAPDSYLVYGDYYPRLVIGENGQSVGSTSMAVQWSDDLSSNQVIWPEEFATVEPRIKN